MPTCGPKIIPQEQLHKAHTLAATVGLGYRIFVVRRYMAMDIIIPYVLWMTVLLFLTDWFIQWVIRTRYAWLDK